MAKRHAWSLLNADEKRKAVLLVLAFVFSGLLETAGVASIGPFMAVVSDPEGAREGQVVGLFYELLTPATHTEFVTLMGIFVVAFLTLNNLVAALVVRSTARFLFGQQHRLSKRLLERYLSQPYSFFLQRNSSDLIKNIFLTVNLVVAGIFMPGVQAFGRSVVAIFILILLVILDPILAVGVAAIFMSAYFLIYARLRRLLHDAGAALTVADRQRNKSASEVLNGIREAKVFNSERWFLRQFSSPSAEYARNATIESITTALPRYALEVMALGTMIFVIVYLFQRNSGDFSSTLTMMSIYAFAAMRLLPALQVIFQGVARVRFNHAALDILVKEFETPLMPPSEDHGGKSLKVEKEIAIEELVFGYEKDTPVLKNVSMVIPKGASVGIVGSSGSGKTTFVDVVLGLLTPGSGRIRVDDQVVTEERFPAWRQSVGYVSQHMFLLDGTIAENIAFGVSMEDIDMAAVERAAKQAHIDDFIRSEPEGYLTTVGERGVRLSGGQRQRIAIARALYADPAILMLDEATNALDNVTEAKITEAIRELSESKTVIMIAHRLSTIRDCSHIFVFDQGEIVGRGRYEELLEENDVFRKLVESGRDGGVGA